MKSLKDRLNDWTDIDYVQFELAVCLGLMEDDLELFRTKAKHIFWTDNKIGRALYCMLMDLVGAGILEYDKEEARFRWNQNFKGDWED